MNTKKKLDRAAMATSNLKSDPGWDSRYTESRPGEAGSIEQHLDMLESGPFRGDEILHHHGLSPDQEDDMINFRMDMSEENREGMEMSGDEHSAGLQGGEPELESQEHIDSGIPGDETVRENLSARRRSSAA